MVRRAAVIVLWALLFSFPKVAVSNEFGNVFGKSVDAATEDGSRRASAEALEGILQIILGIQERELRKGSGVERFQVAEQALGRASELMTKVMQSSIFPESELTAEQQKFLQENLPPGV